MSTLSPQTKPRLLHILRHLWQETDETHYTTIAEIMVYLDSQGISANRKTIADDIAILTEFGFDIICNKSRQSQYFMGNRVFELPELKLLVDAVQASNFITKKKSKALIQKLGGMTSTHQAKELNRNLYVDGRVKPTNENIYYAVDLLHTAINHKSCITFKYYEYNGQKKKVFKHNGKLYQFSPYHMVWSNDSYYVLGYSESHGRIVTFRIDRMYKPAFSDIPYEKKPKDFDVASYCNAIFSMYDSNFCTVELLCDNDIMKAIVDKFGKSVKTEIVDEQHFKATIDVFASPTFFGWVFTYGGQIRILSPEKALTDYKSHINQVSKTL